MRNERTVIKPGAPIITAWDAQLVLYRTTSFRNRQLSARDCVLTLAIDFIIKLHIDSGENAVLAVNTADFIFSIADIPWRSRVVRHRSGVREALGSNPGQGKAWIDYSRTEHVPNTDLAQSNTAVGSQMFNEVSRDRRMNKMMRPMAMIILHNAEEYTTCIQVDLKQDFQKGPVYREQLIVVLARKQPTVGTRGLVVRRQRDRVGGPVLQEEQSIFVLDILAVKLSRTQLTTVGRVFTEIRLVRLLASHLGEMGPVSSRDTPGFPQVGIPANDDVGPRVFSGISHRPPPLHSGAAPHSPRFALIASQDLAVQKRGIDKVKIDPRTYRPGAPITPSSETVCSSPVVLLKLWDIKRRHYYSIGAKSVAKFNIRCSRWEQKSGGMNDRLEKRIASGNALQWDLSARYTYAYPCCKNFSTCGRKSDCRSDLSNARIFTNKANRGIAFMLKLGTVLHLRKGVQTVNWVTCIFCQISDSKQHLSSVMTKEMNYRILLASHLDYNVVIRLAGELHQTADKGHVILLGDAWERYKELAGESSTKLQQSYFNRSTTLKEKLQSQLGNLFTFFQPLDWSPPELLQMKDNTAEDTAEVLRLPKYESEENIILFLIHVALKIRVDLIATTGHQGYTTLDGKNTFLATQMAAWQRGLITDAALQVLQPSTRHSLIVPNVLGELHPAGITPHTCEPVFNAPVDIIWFNEEDNDCSKLAEATDLTFFLSRQDSETRPSWTVFNLLISSVNPKQRAAGYLPIIIAPTHELDTLKSVVKRCMSISSHFGQEHTVITVNEALHCRLMELKLSVPEYQEKLILRLGSVHISMTFTKATGQHMGGSALAEVWLESGLLGQCAVEFVLAGKAYNKTFLSYLAEADNDYHTEHFTLVNNETPERIPELVSLLIQERVRKLLADFIENAVALEFRKGNFVVKGSSQTLNQIDPDQAMEWINDTGNKGGGIMGNTKTSALYRNKAQTFASLYEVGDNTKDKGKKTILKADRNVLQCLITAYEAGRPVGMPNVLKHERLPVPLSLMEMNGTLCTGNKYILTDLITEGISCPETIQLHETSSCLIIDGQALVVALGKPDNALTFGNLADMYVMTVLKVGYRYQRIYVVSDRYREETIKSATRKRRIKSTRPIRRIIEGRDVPLPKNWNNYLTVAENTDLANSLSNELCSQSPEDKEIVVARGFRDEFVIRSSRGTTYINALKSKYEEADTRLVLPVVQSQFRAQWLCHHGAQMFSYFWFPTSSMLIVFKGPHELLKNLDIGTLTEETLKSAEAFVCRIYNVHTTDSVDSARNILFSKIGKPEAVPPTSDALRFHLMRAHYQAMAWRNAHCAMPNLHPISISLRAIPESCLEIISCMCQKRCESRRCKCRKSELRCTSVCVGNRDMVFLRLVTPLVNRCSSRPSYIAQGHAIAQTSDTLPERHEDEDNLIPGPGGALGSNVTYLPTVYDSFKLCNLYFGELRWQNRVACDIVIDSLHIKKKNMQRAVKPKSLVPKQVESYPRLELTLLLPVSCTFCDEWKNCFFPSPQVIISRKKKKDHIDLTTVPRDTNSQQNSRYPCCLPTSFLHRLLHKCEFTPFLIELRVIGGAQLPMGVLHKVRSNDKRVETVHVFEVSRAPKQLRELLHVPTNRALTLAEFWILVRSTDVQKKLKNED
ncbi:hypothetical protein PR048_030127 [Dryococelus australis]|uniref:Uncharacterized protein n=1 Tax=Dryococelus australis TaxID=614101 RepID=A0ABQ9GBY4_9NEOP|nr:hypothetical protein PR048_030127 [Dryococelus australis]